MRAISKVLGAAMLIVLGTAFQAQALTITAGATAAFATGNQTSQAQIDAAILALGITSGELYKQNVGGGESGAYAASYNTVFLNSPTDPKDSDISYTGGPIITAAYNPVYLLVKDGNQTPAWYLYQLSGTGGLGWNGTEILQLREFWPNQGAISHVAFYGTTSTTVPDGGMTVSLLGSALVGLGLLRRKFSA